MKCVHFSAPKHVTACRQDTAVMDPCSKGGSSIFTMSSKQLYSMWHLSKGLHADRTL